MAEINPHPALKAAVPQSPMVDTWMGDDEFHNGAFRNPTLRLCGRAEHGQGRRWRQAGLGCRGDDYTRYLEAGSHGDYARKWGFDALPVRPEADAEPGVYAVLVVAGGR